MALGETKLAPMAVTPSAAVLLPEPAMMRRAPEV